MLFSFALFFFTGALLANATSRPTRHGLLKARQGTTTITNPCSSDSECASGCCGFTLAVCEGPCVALQRDGCGRGDGVSNSNAAANLGTCTALVAAYQPSALAGPAGARGTQFITGPCTTNNDCVSGCCVAATDKCGAVGAQKNGAADCIGGVALPNLNAKR
ncbi:hypothetical protein RQP46_009302 [Phenoliferia psychrophenolica]